MVGGVLRTAGQIIRGSKPAKTGEDALSIFNDGTKAEGGRVAISRTDALLDAWGGVPRSILNGVETVGDFATFGLAPSILSAPIGLLVIWWGYEMFA